MILTTTGSTTTVNIASLGLTMSHPQSVDLLAVDSLWDEDDVKNALLDIESCRALGEIVVSSSGGASVTSALVGVDPLAVRADVDANKEAIAAIGGSLRSEVIQASGRWQARDNSRYYGPSNSYGPNGESWNKNYGSESPNVQALGFVMPWKCKIVSATLEFRRSSTSPTFYARLIRHRKTPGSSVVQNNRIGQVLGIPSGNTDQWEKRGFVLDTNEFLEEADHIVPLLTSDVNTNYYLYFNMRLEIEEVE